MTGRFNFEDLVRPPAGTAIMAQLEALAAQMATLIEALGDYEVSEARALLRPALGALYRRSVLGGGNGMWGVGARSPEDYCDALRDVAAVLTAMIRDDGEGIAAVVAGADVLAVLSAACWWMLGLMRYPADPAAEEAEVRGVLRFLTDWIICRALEAGEEADDHD